LIDIWDSVLVTLFSSASSVSDNFELGSPVVLMDCARKLHKSLIDYNPDYFDSKQVDFENAAASTSRQMLGLQDIFPPINDSESEVNHDEAEVNHDEVEDDQREVIKKKLEKQLKQLEITSDTTGKVVHGVPYEPEDFRKGKR